MVIKLRSIINKIISIGVCVLLSFSIYKKCNQESQTPRKIVIQADSLLSDQASFSLNTFIQTNTSFIQNSSFDQLLLSQFPYINCYEIEENASGNRICTLQAADPVLSINNIWALTKSGRLAHLADFSCFATQSLPNVIMPNLTITEAFITSIQKIAPEFFKSYCVIWINDQEALLYDREQPLFAIRFNADSIPHHAVIKQCTVIKNDLEARGLFANASGKKKPQQLIADIRFKNQIILSRNVEGANYG
jgi:hypothetical protein